LELSSLDNEQLRNLLVQVRAQIPIAERDAIIQIHAQIASLARQAGVPVEKIIPFDNSRRSPLRGVKIAMRYQHPTKPQWQWTGRGMQPHWVKAWIADHGSIDDLLISTNGVEKDVL
jgi:DNA-binding protein H-NS